MRTHKRIREKGKISFTRFFQTFKEGEAVALVRDLGLPGGAPKRMQGRTGKIIAKRGSAYVVEVKDLNSPKQFMVHPIHLRRIQQ